MKLTCVVVLILFTPGLASSEPLTQTPEGLEFLKSLEPAIAVNDTLGQRAAAEQLEAQTRIAAMGTRADDMLAQMVLEAMESRPSGGLDISPLPGNVFPDLLVYLVSYDPAQTTKLVGPLTAWMDGAAMGKFPESGSFSQRAAVYINRWGGTKEKAQIRRDIEKMLKSSVYDVHENGRMAQRGLDGYTGGILGFDTKFSSWCQWNVDRSRMLKEGKSPAAPSPAKDTGMGGKPDRSQPTLAQDHLSASSFPSTQRSWLIWLLIAIGVAGGILWLAIRMRKQRA